MSNENCPTQSEKAVAVAKDVIERLDMGLSGYLAEPGTYIGLEEISRDEADDDLQSIVLSLDEQNVKCEVCALGAAILSKAMLYDQLPISSIFDFYGYDEEIIEVDIDDNKIRRHLMDIFSLRDIVLIESAFECDTFLFAARYIDNDIEVGDEDINTAIAFGERHHDPHYRLKAIMQNIIDNNGEFKPNV